MPVDMRHLSMRLPGVIRATEPGQGSNHHAFDIWWLLAPMVVAVVSAALQPPFFFSMGPLPPTKASCWVLRSRCGGDDYCRRWLWLSRPLFCCSFSAIGPLPPTEALCGVPGWRRVHAELGLTALAPWFRKRTSPPENFCTEHRGRQASPSG